MKLFVDDIRQPPDDSWTLARTITEAIRVIELSHFDEISLDHDISHGVTVGWVSRPFPCSECFCSVATYVGVKYSSEKVKPKVIIHTANPVGAGDIASILTRYGVEFTIKSYPPASREPS